VEGDHQDGQQACRWVGLLCGLQRVLPMAVENRVCAAVTMCESTKCQADEVEKPSKSASQPAGAYCVCCLFCLATKETVMSAIIRGCVRPCMFTCID
jgi:hypothetical protein